MFLVECEFRVILSAKNAGWSFFILAIFATCAGCHSFKSNPFKSYVEMTPFVAHESGLHAKFFGNSTLIVKDSKTSVMIDGFFSRPGLLKLLFGQIEPNIDRINVALTRGDVRKLNLLLVAHSHHDHAMDAPYVAKKTGALLGGSSSTLRIAANGGIATSQLRELVGGKSISVGAFEIDVFETPHSDNPIFKGHVDPLFQTPARLSDYKFDKNYSFLLKHRDGNILIVPSANFECDMFAGVTADVVFLGVGNIGNKSKQFIYTFWEQAVLKTKAKLVVPIHWDNFLRSLNSELVPFPRIFDDTARSVKYVQELGESFGIAVKFLPLYKPVALPKVIFPTYERIEHSHKPTSTCISN